jgi:Asp-tRNA(Asn)/Glu-tRNA(Gln) amidotransferase A subunit family amidase
MGAAAACVIPLRDALAANEAESNSLEYRSATELVAALAGRRISSAELVDFSISRIEALDKSINAVVVRDFESARGGDSR